MDSAVVSFKNVHFGYTAGEIVFDNLSTEVPKGSYIGFSGNNGCGKSTFFKLIIGTLKPLSGQVQVSTNHLVYLPQNSNFDRTFPISIGDILKMARFVNKQANISTDRLFCILEKVGLQKSLSCPIKSLSGGQFQRVIFARMLLIDPDLLILDEPFNEIDEKTIEDLAEILKEINKQNKTILLAVHDSCFLKTHVPDVMELKNGILMKPEVAV